ncbi:hypothetical protein N9C74_02455 [Pontimonas sp.]|nr:hypothetical protein [Pontimonas sp.]
MLALFRRLGDANQWQALIFRGNRMFLAFGGLYVRSPTETMRISQSLMHAIPEAPKGKAFVRVTLNPRKNPELAVLIAGIGRFGNSVAQVLNSIRLAQVLQSNLVLFHRFDAIGNKNVNLGNTHKLVRLTGRNTTGGSAPGVIWRTYSITPNILFCDPCADDLREARQALGLALNIAPLPRPVVGSTQTLTIHVRGGDVFSSKPERYYGQPPWAFYRRVLESATWGTVELVSEDDSNPVVPLIRKWCDEHSADLQEPGHEFRSAVSAISNARHLVAAHGTFAPSIAYLSGGSRVVFQFHEQASQFFCPTHTKILTVHDLRGEYVEAIMNRNWQNTDKQRNMMTTYPLDSLSQLTESHAV